MSDPNMNEQNMIESDYQVKELSREPGWTPPPFPVEPMSDEEPVPEMSEVGSLTGIFFEPSRTFESFRKKPRFITAMLICIVAYLAFVTVFFTKVDYNKFIRSAMENSPRSSSLTQEQIDQQVAFQTKPIFKIIFVYVFPFIVFLIIFAIGGLLYMGGVMMMGGSIKYLQALSVWVYSSLPPTLIAMLLNIVLVFVKSPDSYDQVAASRRGLVQANLGILFNAKDAPVLHALMSQFDIFVFYGLFLAALGLRIIGKISSGLAWTIVLMIFLIRIAVSVVGGMFGG